MADVRKLMMDLKANPCKETIDNLVKELHNIELYLPVVVKDPEDKESIRIINETHKISEGTTINPAVVITQDGKKFLSAFTSTEDFEKTEGYTETYQGYITVDFNFCMKISAETEDIEALVINPFTENVILNISKNPPGQEANEAPANDMDPNLQVRQHLEIRILPYNIFNSENFLQALKEDGENLLAQMYSELYKKDTKLKSPFSPSDFDIMNLNIDENVSITRITMPNPGNVPAMAKRVFIANNPETDEKVYYAIVTDPNNDQLFALYKDGKSVNLGNAPEEVVELNTVIDCFKEYMNGGK
ncbi:MAG: SseB family protein [Lachnospiraceae bacterium]|nr:SseB family protein [Lachnospiraceae bacterium]